MIPITIAQSVEVMVAANRLGAGTVGTSNGRAAIRLSSIEQISPIVAAATTILQAAVDFKHNRSTTKAHEDSVERMEHAAEDIGMILAHADVSPEQREILEQATRDLLDQAQRTRQVISTMPETASGAGAAFHEAGAELLPARNSKSSAVISVAAASGRPAMSTMTPLIPPL